MRLFILALLFFGQVSSEEKSIVIIVPSFNNISYFKNNIDSILNQNYGNFRVIYIDDSSTDGMTSCLKKYLKEKEVDFSHIVFKSILSESAFHGVDRFVQTVKDQKPFFLLIENKNRAGALANIYRSISTTLDSDLIVLIDGDDSFFDQDVLNKVNRAYSSSDEVFLTHGKLIEIPSGSVSWCERVPEEIVEKNAFRKFRCPSHLRTFYSWLFKKIKFEDLLYKGDFFQMTWDMAIMYPMIEMAGKRHQFLSEVNYCYNMENSINDNKVNPQLQNDLDRWIRNMTPYQPLNEENIPRFME